MGARFFQYFLLFAIGVSVIALVNPSHDLVQAALLSGSVMLPIYLAGESTIGLTRGLMFEDLKSMSDTRVMISSTLLFVMFFIFYALFYRWVFVVLLGVMK